LLAASSLVLSFWTISAKLPLNPKFPLGFTVDN
jgi:hypothetical protein